MTLQQLHRRRNRNAEPLGGRPAALTTQNRERRRNVVGLAAQATKLGNVLVCDAERRQALGKHLRSALSKKVPVVLGISGSGAA